MSDTHLAQIKTLLLALAEYYQAPLTANQLVMYASDLAQFSIQSIAQVIQRYRADPKNNRFPIPAQLIRLLHPTITDDAQAVEVANRIWGAIAQFGWPNPSAAEKHIGPLGWIIVERLGGWRSVCDESGTGTAGVFRAQLRESAKSVIERAKAGILNTPPGLPDRSGPAEHIGTIVNKVLESQHG